MAAFFLFYVFYLIMRKEPLTVALLALTIVAAVAVRADEPLPPPSTHEAVSQNSAFIAISSPTNGTRVLNNATKQELWSTAGWFRWLFVSNDGNHVVTGYDGMNLIPLNFTDDLVLLTFWKKGKEMRKVTLKEIVPSKSILTRTVSHYHWGTIDGINDRGSLVVKRSDGKTLLFDVTTGAQR